MSPHRALIRRMRCRKRAQVLMLIGWIFVLTGWVQADTAHDLEASVMAPRVYVAHLGVMPLEAWGWTFMAAGCVAVASALVGGVYQWVSFAVLQALSIFWGSLFVASWLESGYNRAWVQALTWATVSGVLLIVADWEDPPGGGGCR